MAGTNIGTAYVQIVPSAEGINGAITAALGNEATQAGTTSGNNFASAMGGVLTKGAAITAAATAATAAAVAGVSKAVIDGASGVAQYGDNIDKMSQKLGISATAYQEWDAVMQHSGTSIDGMQRGMTTLSKQAEKGSDAFQKLGISQKQVSEMSKEDLFAAVISGLQNMEEGTERTVLAQELLGGAAKELGPLLNTSAEETQNMRDRVHELGGVMSDEAVKAAAAYQDSFQDMSTAFEGAKRGMLSEFLPSITSVMDGLTEVFSGNGDKGIGLINKGISGFIDNLSNTLPKAIEAGSKIISTLLEALIENLPRLIEAGLKAVQTIGQGILDNLPMIIDSAVQIIGTLLRGLSESLPQIVDGAAQLVTGLAQSIGEAAPTIIPQAVDAIITTIITLLDNVDALVDGAIALVTGLTDGIINALPILIDRLPEIVLKIVEALIMNAPQLLSVGPQLMLSLVGGLIQSLPQLIAMGPQMVGELMQALINDAPRLIDSGVEQVVKFIEGITQMIPTLLEMPAEIIGLLGDVLLDAGQGLIEIGATVANFIGEGISGIFEDVYQWGCDLMETFADGIGAGIDFVKDALEAVADAIASLIHFSEPDKGPLKNFHTFAPDMMQLFTKGIKDNTDMLTDQVKKSFDLKNIIVGDVDVASSDENRANESGFVQNLTINAPQELNPSEIARQTRNINRELVLQLRTT